MNTEEYLHRLYAGITEGVLGVTYFKNNKTVNKWFTKEQIPQMAAFIRHAGARVNTFLCLNPRKANLGAARRGSEEDIACIVGAYCDFDIKSVAHAQERLPQSNEELFAFIGELPLKPTVLTFSGNGYHAIWLFEEPLPVETGVPVIKGWEQYVNAVARNKYGWIFDSVADAARMLRAVGSRNFKTAEQPLCETVYFNDNRYSASDFERFFDTSPASVPQHAFDDFGLLGTGSAEEMISKCRFLKHCRDDAATLPEPEWHAAISNLALTADGREVIHQISKPYPNYSFEETEQKYLYAAKADKPVTCEYIHRNLGFDCKKICGVKSPVALSHASEKQATSPPNWEQPIPFNDFHLPAFPVDALPPEISAYVTSLAESTQTPVDMAATAALAVMAVAAQSKYTIKAKEDWTEPLNLYTEIVMEPSERKSAVANAMLRPVNEYESEFNRQIASEIEHSKMRKNILERRRKAIEDKAAKGKASEEELIEVAEELASFRETKPLKLYVDDVTTEKLTSVLAENNGHAAIMSTEGGIFDTLAGVYTKNVNIDVILKGYSGDCIRVDRIGRSSESVMNPALTMMLMAQPSVLSGMMRNSTFRGRGLTARFLYCIPKSLVGKRRYRTEPIPDEVRRAYDAHIKNILGDAYPQEPEIITLSDEADKLLEAFSTELEPKLKAEYADISEWAGKLAGNVLRIAGLLCRASVVRENWDWDDFLYDDPEPLMVDAQTMSNAIRIGRYFIDHAKASFALMDTDDTVKNSVFILEIIRKNGLREFSRRNVMRLCRRFKKVEALQPLLDFLTEYGYIAPKDAEQYFGKGRPPSAIYLVNPYVYNK